MYDQGKGVIQDYEEAFKWYQLAADQEYARAQYSLGYMYEDGEGVDRDYAEAVKWWRLAAEQGVAEAQYLLDHLLAQHPELAQQQPTDPPTPPS